MDVFVFVNALECVCVHVVQRDLRFPICKYTNDFTRRRKALRSLRRETEKINEKCFYLAERQNAAEVAEGENAEKHGAIREGAFGR